MSGGSEAQSLVLVTGATGYLAGWVVVALLQRGYRVRGTIRRPEAEAEVRAGVAKQVQVTDGRLELVQADLRADAGWAEAVRGCDCVLHVASDMGASKSTLPDLLEVARDGTVRVIRASVRAGVKRVVVTSSCRALFDSSTGSGSLTESDWGDGTDSRLRPYFQSKIIAEQTAWAEIQQQQPAQGQMTTLTTVLPSLIQGPILFHSLPHSAEMISRMLNGKAPALPNLKVSIVDVRDAAEAHVLAMASPAAAGQRYIVTHETLPVLDIARCLKSELPAESANVGTRSVPDWLIRLAACVSAEAAFVADSLGKDIHYDSSKARNQLGWTARPAHETIVDAARSLIQAGLVKST